MSEEFHDRLALARRQAGFTGSRDAARAFGWNENTYKSHETGVRAGTRPPEQEVVRKYARAFGVDFVWLLTGEGTAKRRNAARVVGRIGAGAEILPDFEQIPPEGLFEIEAPFTLPEDAIAFEVEGESMWPRYDPGDVIICWREGVNVEDMLGWEAAVRTEDGRRFLKRILRGAQPGLYDLESHNSPAIRGVRIVWAAGIAAVVRSGQWKRLDHAGRRKLMAKTVRGKGG
jgi:transcriptional regulator with XRE-family HTH domain